MQSAMGRAPLPAAARRIAEADGHCSGSGSSVLGRLFGSTRHAGRSPAEAIWPLVSLGFRLAAQPAEQASATRIAADRRPAARRRRSQPARRSRPFPAGRRLRHCDPRRGRWSPATHVPSAARRRRERARRRRPDPLRALGDARRPPAPFTAAYGRAGGQAGFGSTQASSAGLSQAACSSSDAVSVDWS